MPHFLSLLEINYCYNTKYLRYCCINFYWATRQLVHPLDLRCPWFVESIDWQIKNVTLLISSWHLILLDDVDCSWTLLLLLICGLNDSCSSFIKYILMWGHSIKQGRVSHSCICCYSGAQKVFSIYSSILGTLAHFLSLYFLPVLVVISLLYLNWHW